MTATPSIDLPGWMTEQLSQASPDLLRQMVQTVAEALMSADADAGCNSSPPRAAASDRSWQGMGAQSAAFFRCSSLYAARRRACSIGAPAATASRRVPTEAL